MTSSVSYLLFAYNQERFIAAALKSAFDQTYDLMEIIVTDDCSTDGTAFLIEQAIAAYDGPKAIRFIRNAANVGVGSAINNAISAALGDLIVMAAGDDISMPDRTSTVVDAFTDPAVYLAFSKAEIIGEDGVPRGVFHRMKGEARTLLNFARSPNMGTLGATNAFRRDIFEVFGPLDPEIVFEDRVLPFRAAMLGKVSYIDATLVHYRQHDANIWARASDDLSDVETWRKYLRRRNRLMIPVLESRLRDIETGMRLYPERRCEFLHVKERTAYFLMRTKAEEVLCSDPPLLTKMRLASRVLHKSGLTFRQSWGWVKKFLLPRLYYQHHRGEIATKQVTDDA